MKTDILIVQRFYYNFREGFFDYLHELNINFKLINSTNSRGRVTVHKTAKHKRYIKRVPSIGLGRNYIIFPFLILHILSIRPKWVISEGGQNTFNNLQVLLYRFLTGKAYIIWDLGKGYDEFPDSFLRKIYMFFYKRTLKKASWIYTYNSAGKEYFKSLGMDADKVLVLNNTVDTRKIRRLRDASPALVPEELRDKIKKDNITLIFVGALLPSKNIEDLKDLLVLLGNKYTLIVVGDGNTEYRNKLFKLFENTNSHFVGYKKIDEITSYYNQASFAILPGLGGLSINQAMAFGLPVICRRADGAEKDLVKNNDTGYIYSSLQDAAVFIKSKSPEDWKKMGLQAEKLIFSEHSIDSMAEKFLSKLNIHYEGHQV